MTIKRRGEILMEHCMCIAISDKKEKGKRPDDVIARKSDHEVIPSCF